MFFYFLHQVNNSLFPDWAESKKNCFTLFFGANLHLLLFVYLEYLIKYNQNVFLELFRRFYSVFIFIDAFTMACLYKLYWGRTIVAEMAPDENGWDYDEDKHRYLRQQKTPTPETYPTYPTETYQTENIPETTLVDNETTDELES